MKQYAPITIVMTHVNRKPQLINTLNSIRSSKFGVRVIIVDDHSRPEHDISDLAGGDIEVIHMPKKKWVNPCIPFNTGLIRANNDIVIIQNAECMHVGDIIAHAKENSAPNVYLNYSAYSINQELTDRLISGEPVKKVIYPFNDSDVAEWGGNCWYNHPKIRPKGAHFCSAIRWDDLYSLGGFDERFANAMGFDDDELLSRIRRKGMDFRMIRRPFVVHQRHEHCFDADKVVDSMAENSALYDKAVKESNWDAKKHNMIFV